MKLNCFFCCMSERRFTRRSSSIPSIKDCIHANNNLSRFDNISFKTGLICYIFFKLFYLEEADIYTCR